MPLCTKLKLFYTQAIPIYACPWKLHANAKLGRLYALGLGMHSCVKYVWGTPQDIIIRGKAVSKLTPV